jgi:phosphorylase kinase alpha/beta subunit
VSTGLLLPQYFYIPADQIERERARPGSADRIPSDVGSTKGIFLWGQSVYFISQLLGKTDTRTVKTMIGIFIHGVIV